MKIGSETIHRNMVYVMLTLFALGVLVMMARGGGSTFFLIFWVIPAAFWTTRRFSGSCDNTKAKRKNDGAFKRKNDDSDTVGTLTTVDGEVFDIVEEKPLRRQDDFI